MVIQVYQHLILGTTYFAGLLFGTLVALVQPWIGLPVLTVVVLLMVND